MFWIVSSPPCIVLSDVLVFADPHLGLSIVGYKLSRKSERFLLRSEVDSIVQPILSLNKKFRRVIVLGDVKDYLGFPKKVIREAICYFFRKLRMIADDILVVRGNHDGYLVDVLDECNIDVSVLDHVLMEHKNKKILLGHGHMKFPHEKIIVSDYILIGHVHPASSLGEKSWIFSRFSIMTDSRKHVDCFERGALNLIVFPSSNPRLVGSVISSRDSINSIMSRVLPKECSISICSVAVFDTRFNLVDIL